MGLVGLRMGQTVWLTAFSIAGMHWIILYVDILLGCLRFCLSAILTSHYILFAMSNLSVSVVCIACDVYLAGMLSFWHHLAQCHSPVSSYHVTCATCMRKQMTVIYFSLCTYLHLVHALLQNNFLWFLQPIQSVTRRREKTICIDAIEIVLHFHVPILQDSNFRLLWIVGHWILAVKCFKKKKKKTLSDQPRLLILVSEKYLCFLHLRWSPQNRGGTIFLLHFVCVCVCQW